MEATPKWKFSQNSQVKSLKIFKIEIFAILDARNFLCKLLIEAKFKSKL